VDQVDICIKQRFSAAAYQAWRGAHCFITADGSLLKKKTEYDFEMAKYQALAAMHAELAWWGRWILSPAGRMIRSIRSLIACAKKGRLARQYWWPK
jgi:hypothetical protein